MLCRACSEGRPHRVHDTDRSADTRRLPCAIAALDEAQVDRILAAWKGRLPHIKVLERWLVTP
jgi:hypothetical protein